MTLKKSEEYNSDILAILALVVNNIPPNAKKGFILGIFICSYHIINSQPSGSAFFTADNISLLLVGIYSGTTIGLFADTITKCYSDVHQGKIASL